jgi:predicted FMN-binding regulatory protein PaiB
VSTGSLYVPPQFNCTDIDKAQALLRAYPLAQLVSVGSDGAVFISPLPLETSTSDPWVLIGHLANANPQVALLKTNRKALVTVMGPQASVSNRLSRFTARTHLELRHLARAGGCTADRSSDRQRCVAQNLDQNT